jgi:hypothetical protein
MDSARLCAGFFFSGLALLEPASSGRTQGNTKVRRRDRKMEIRLTAVIVKRRNEDKIR